MYTVRNSSNEIVAVASRKQDAKALAQTYDEPRSLLEEYPNALEQIDILKRDFLGVDKHSK